MQHEISRAFHIDVGHRVYGHESKCAHLHGHRYTITVTLRSRDLDDLGRVVDFGDMVSTIGEWLLTNWDHGLVLFADDPFVELFACPTIQSPVSTRFPILQTELSRQKMFILPTNPTAENMAQYLMDDVVPDLIPGGVFCSRVTVQETPNCNATAYPQPQTEGGVVRTPMERAAASIA
jgi:6-pyruvoyltetrahydropterin/6-carboxytetrahydropterin synthase